MPHKQLLFRSEAREEVLRGAAFFDDFSEVTDEMVVNALSHPVRAA